MFIQVNSLDDRIVFVNVLQIVSTCVGHLSLGTKTIDLYFDTAEERFILTVGATTAEEAALELRLILARAVEAAAKGKN